KGRKWGLGGGGQTGVNSRRRMVGVSARIGRLYRNELPVRLGSSSFRSYPVRSNAVGVQIAMTALADASCFMISSRSRPAVPRLVSHQNFQPSASSIATSLDASDRSVLA